MGKVIMVTSFIEYMGWVSLSLNLKDSFERAQQAALDLNHQELDIPHLLYALIDNPEAAIALSKHHIDREQLRHHLSHHALAFANNGLLLKNNNLTEYGTFKPTKRIQRLMAQASQKAEMVGKREIDGEDVINSLISIEKELSNHYSNNKNDRKQDVATSAFYKYQEDLFSYDRNNRLTNWKFSSRQQTPSHDFYLTQGWEDQTTQCNTNVNLLVPQKPTEDQYTGPDKTMKYSYPAHNTLEYAQIQSSLDSLMERRADAEGVLQDCEWYQLLKNLEQVSDNLDDTVDRHQKKLVRKARQEIDKVDRWRKAYHYIEHLDHELAKFRKLEESALREETAGNSAKDIVILEMEDREMSKAIEERMHLLEKHVNQLEKKLKISKKSRKYASLGHVNTKSVADDSYGHAPTVSDYYLESLKDKIQTLEGHIDKQDYHIATLRDQSNHRSDDRPDLDREKVTLKHEISLIQRENDGLTHKISGLEQNMSQQAALIASLRDQSSQRSISEPEFEREKATLKHEISLIQRENDSLTHKVASLENHIQQQDGHLGQLKEETNRHSSNLPALEREKVTLKHEVDMLQTENEDLTHRIAELETTMTEQDGHIMTLREKASRRKERLTALSGEHESIVPALEAEKATLKHEISMIQDENDALTHKIAELETQHHSLSEQYSGSSSEFSALKDAYDRVTEKNDKRKQYILSLEEQIKGLESNNQRQDKLVIDLHSEIEGYKASVEHNKQTIGQLVAQINSHKDSTHLLAQEKLTADERLKLISSESDQYGEKARARKQQIQTLEQQIKAHEEFSQTREQRVKALQNEVSTNSEILTSVNEKLTLQKDKAASRERHIRTLEQHVKVQENELAIMKKQMATRPEQMAAPVYAAPGRRSTVAWRETDSLVEIVRASM